MSIALPYMRSARSDQLNLILHNIISHPGNAKLRLCFDAIFSQKIASVFLCCSKVPAGAL